jgi:HEAT repeat protein
MRRLLLVLGILLLTMGSPVSAQKQIMDFADAMKAIKSANASDRSAALALMAYMGTEANAASKDVVGLLVNDPSPMVRGWAATCLTKVNPDLAPPVLDLVNGTDGQARMDALQKLVAMGPDQAGVALSAVAKFLNQADGPDRPKVIAAMAKLGAKDPAMATMLANIGIKDKDPAVRQAALASLPKMGDVQGALSLFDGLLKNTDPAERALAVTGLTALAAKYPQAMKTLQSTTSDPSPTVSGAAKQAVEKIKKEQQKGK